MHQQGTSYQIIRGPPGKDRLKVHQCPAFRFVGEHHVQTGIGHKRGLGHDVHAVQYHTKRHTHTHTHTQWRLNTESTQNKLGAGT